jgi:hypothetical protein
MRPEVHEGRWSRAAALIIAVVLFSSACAEDPTVLFGALDARTHSLIIGFAQGEHLAVYAANADRRLQIEPPTAFNADDEIRVSRVQLEPALDALGLHEGWLEPAPAPNRSLGSINRLLDELARTEAGVAAPFVPGPLEPALLEFPLPFPPCPSFRFQPIPELIDAGTTVGRVVAPDGTAIFFAQAGLVVVQEDQPPRLLPFPGEYLVHAAISPEGGVWLLSQLRMAQINLQTGAAEREVPRPPGSQVGGLVVEREVPLLAHVLDIEGKFWRLENEGWRLVEGAPEARIGRIPIGRIAMMPLEPGTFLASASLLAAVYRYQAGTYTIDLEPGILERGFPAIDRDRADRLLAIEEYTGQLYLRAADEWRPGPKIEPTTNSLAPFGSEDLLLFVSGSGSFGLVSPEAGVACGPQQLGTAAVLRDVARVGDRFLVAGAEDGEVPVWGWLSAE